MSPAQAYNNHPGIYSQEHMPNIATNNLTTQWYAPNSVCLLVKIAVVLKTCLHFFDSLYKADRLSSPSTRRS
jgi:hypothetical protein